FVVFVPPDVSLLSVLSLCLSGILPASTVAPLLLSLLSCASLFRPVFFFFFGSSASSSVPPPRLCRRRQICLSDRAGGVGAGYGLGSEFAFGQGFGFGVGGLSLIHIAEPTRRTPSSYAGFGLKKKKGEGGEDEHRTEEREEREGGRERGEVPGVEKGRGEAEWGR
ncbi:hypothetical protein, partial [Streptomyces sp. V2]|uniref:hypothetical protein n=1 Tax=Streptomyces sp. V2 TaxID=1424099 RepID=UPI0019D027F5